MKTIILLITTLILAGSAPAGSYQIVHQEQINGAVNYVHIDPILGEGNIESGFVFTDATASEVTIRPTWLDSNIVLQTEAGLVKSLGLVRKDSLVVFVLHNQLTRYSINDGILSDTTMSPVRYPSGGIGLTRVDADIWFRDRSASPVDLLVTATFFVEYMDMTMGYGEEYTGSCSILNEDLESLVSRRDCTRIDIGNLSSAPGSELAHYSKRQGFYHYNDGDIPDSRWDDLTVQVIDASALKLARKYTNGGGGEAIFVDDFDNNPDFDEVIFYGYAVDLLNRHSRSWHVACYSFASGEPEEIWYAPLSGVSLDYVYKPQHFIAGMRGKNEVIALNYWTGQISDSIQLDRELEATTFFETGSNPSLLNLVGRNHDTIFVYQFQTPTDINDEAEIVLPSSFELVQNYPNPFNNETVISFVNPARQRLTLTVYNVLGQEVTTFLSKELSTGEYSFAWDGLASSRRPVASGVYFARLASATESQLIKMVLLK